MKISQFDTVARHIACYKDLVAALDAVNNGHLTISAQERSYGDDPVRYNIPALTTTPECRDALKAVLIRHIGDAKQALATYGVDIDE